ncbi:MAG: autotransporter-associated beta strand repeat-containing protein [Moraxellaceae bacterium]|nr:autotransporter-associated beta strand repeat-containing protein [Moraxellaceae bacterium]
MTGVISGTGSLVKDGAGQLNLTGANSYAGGNTS